MELKQAKDYWGYGVIESVGLMRDPLMDGNWLICLVRSNGDSCGMTTALKEEKTYSTLDSAMREIERITCRVSSFNVVRNSKRG